MRLGQSLLCGCAVLLLCGGLARADAKDDAAKLLMGKWEASEKVGDQEVSLTLEFTKDNKMSIKAKSGGKDLFAGPAPRTIGVLARTLADRGDPKLMFDAEVEVALPTR